MAGDNTHEWIGGWRTRWRQAQERHLFLDYDGTLRELAPTPDQAAPTQAVLALLGALSAAPATRVHVVSGRPAATLDAWLGGLSLQLCAEHGLMHRGPGTGWQRRAGVDLSWVPQVAAALQRWTVLVPGSLLERKHGGVAWHHRGADPGTATRALAEMHVELERLLAAMPAVLRPGHGVLEVRSRDFDKGTYVAGILRGVPAATFSVCAGDDRTDRDMFSVMPSDALVVQVGPPVPGVTCAVPDPAALRSLLQSLLE